MMICMFALCIIIAAFSVLNRTATISANPYQIVLEYSMITVPSSVFTLKIRATLVMTSNTQQRRNTCTENRVERVVYPIFIQCSKIRGYML